MGARQMQLRTEPAWWEGEPHSHVHAPWPFACLITLTSSTVAMAHCWLAWAFPQPYISTWLSVASWVGGPPRSHSTQHTVTAHSHSTPSEATVTAHRQRPQSQHTVTAHSHSTQSKPTCRPPNTVRGHSPPRSHSTFTAHLHPTAQEHPQAPHTHP